MIGGLKMRPRLTNCRRNIVLACIVVLSFSGCYNTKLFIPIDPGKEIKAGRLAVLSGSDSDFDVNFAEYITEELRTNTTFQVMTQTEIRNKVHGYPLPLIDPAAAKAKADPFGAFPGNKAKLDAIQKQLKADYLYVVWIQNVKKTIQQTSTFGTTRVMRYEAEGRARMLQYPSGSIIAYSEISGFEHPGLISSKKEPDYIEIMLKNMAYNIRTKFAEVTRSAKESK